MTIVICVKPVRAEIVYTNEKPDDSLVLNPYDLHTLQQVVALKKEMDVKIICLCMGPERAESVLTRCLAMGADEAIILKDSAFSGSDTYATSYIISKALKMIGQVDMVVCGEKAVDGETGQVAYSIAKRLRLPCISGVIQILKIQQDRITLRCQQDDYIETRMCDLPALLIYQGFILSETELSLLALKRAKQTKITALNANLLNIEKSNCGQHGSKTKVISVDAISYSRNSQCLEGTSAMKAEMMYNLILNKR